MPISLSERLPCSNHACAPQERQRINELTRSFVKASLKTLMRNIGSGSGALFLFDPEAHSLVLESLLGISPDSAMRYFWMGRRPCLSIPLFARGELFGLVKIGTRQDGARFSAQDLRYASTICEYICRIVDDQMSFALQRSALDRARHEKRLLEKYASVGSLAAGIVGRINSPLDAALRYTGLVRSQLDFDDRRAEYLSQVRAGLERISDITASLAGLYVVPRDPADTRDVVDIHSLIDEAVSVFRMPRQNQVRIKVFHDGPLLVRADRAMRHVFTNIIKNAFEAMPGGGELNIRSEIKQAGLQIVFQDTGCGMTIHDQKRLFEPFFTTKPKEAGNGIGLALCRDIIERYGGRIVVKSAPGAGSTFTILFPRSILAQEERGV